jgi:serine/threonine protein kinase
MVPRDLKVDNILLDAQRKVKVIDFGLDSRYLIGEELTDGCGAFTYQAQKSPCVYPIWPKDGCPEPRYCPLRYGDGRLSLYRGDHFAGAAGNPGIKV